MIVLGDRSTCQSYLQKYAVILNGISLLTVSKQTTNVPLGNFKSVPIVINGAARLFDTKTNQLVLNLW